MRQRRRLGYQISPFPWLRVPIVDSMRAAWGKPLMHALVETDVTLARESLRAHEQRAGEKLSFTAFITECVGRTVAEYPITQAYRLGRGRLIRFDDVDVCAQIEHAAGGGRQASPYVIRAANRKPLRAIHEEIRAVQAADVGGAWEMRGRRLYPYLPRPLRMAFWWAFNRYPRMKKRIGGTVMISAVGMFGRGASWGLSQISDYTLQIILGGVVERPVIVEGHVEGRQYLCMTVSADHDILDGAPFARFIQRLSELIESGYGLEEAGVSLAVQAGGSRRADVSLAGR
jgi:pyruvate/2-oxoglutarate dehydrogenase complex dihydrolipoamide acyltransferase (E2) component